MKILIIQLTRPGDIFCTWPALSALRRKHPNAEIHLLVRKKFIGAAKDFFVVDHLWSFDTEKILSPLIFDPLVVQDSHYLLSQFISELRSQKFDKIINLTFSPSSSFLTHLISTDNTDVRGYTRTSDFYLHIPDEASRYFKAQVGLNKSNHLHVADLFAMVAQCELETADMRISKTIGEREGIVCHMGASQSHKTWPTENWIQLIDYFIKAGEKIILVGSKEDLEGASQIEEKLKSENIENLVGKTTFSELRRLFSKSKLFIGGDSGPLHVASVAGCVSINLSVGNVNFWETGPTVAGSQVLVAKNPDNLKPYEVFLTSKEKNSRAYFCDGQKMVRFDDQAKDTDGGWPAVLWIYFDGPVPAFSNLDLQFAQQISETCEIATHEIFEFIKNPNKSLSILDRADEILKVIGESNTIFRPLINYFFTEKENILPGSQQQVAEHTLACYTSLKNKLGPLEESWHERKLAP